MTGARPGEEAGRAKQPVSNSKRGKSRLERPSADETSKLSETVRQGFEPAVLIGLVVAFVRQGGIAAVPDVLLAPLVVATLDGCGASKAALAWLGRRAKTAAPSSHTTTDAKAREVSDE